MAIRIPTRPKCYNKNAIKKIDADCLTYSVLMGGKNEDCYFLFHPEFSMKDGTISEKGKEACKQFFMYARNREYIDAYREELEEFLKHGTEDPKEDEPIDGDALARKVLSDLAVMVKNGRIQDFEVLKIATDILNKYGVLKGSEEKLEDSRRYIPLRCLTECQYRVICEGAIERGEIENECLYCKALAIAKEHGYAYDPTTNLNIPQQEEAVD